MKDFIILSFLSNSNQLPWFLDKRPKGTNAKHEASCAEIRRISTAAGSILSMHAIQNNITTLKHLGGSRYMCLHWIFFYWSKYLKSSYSKKGENSTYTLLLLFDLKPDNQTELPFLSSCYYSVGCINNGRSTH